MSINNTSTRPQPWGPLHVVRPRPQRRRSTVNWDRVGVVAVNLAIGGVLVWAGVLVWSL